VLLVGLKLWTGSDNDIRRRGRDSEGVPVNSSHGSRRQITLRDECRLLAGNSEIGRSSPPSFSNVNRNHYTSTKSTVNCCCWSLVLPRIMCTVQSCSNSVNSSQRGETRRSTRHTILRCDELTGFSPPKSINQMANRSVQPFLHSRVSSGTLAPPGEYDWNCAHGRHLANTIELEPTQVHNANGKSIGSAVSAQLTAKSPYTLQWATISPRLPLLMGDLVHI